MKIPENEKCTSPACRGGQVWLYDGRVTQDCDECYGTGRRGMRRPRPCKSCQGLGYNQGACVDCNGTGKKIS